VLVIVAKAFNEGKIYDTKRPAPCNLYRCKSFIIK
jgi:hypothetical protein